MSLTYQCRQGALLLTAFVVASCAADPGEDTKPAYVASGEHPTDDGAVTDDRASASLDSSGAPDVPDSGSTCPSTAPTLCSDTCVDTTTSSDNCGGCGLICTGDIPCVGSHCATGDAAGVDARADGGGVDANASPDGAADARADASVDAKPPADSAAVEAQAAPDAKADSAEDSGAPCPQCTGCCDEGGNCGKGTSATACGVAGVVCVDCTATSLTCHTGGICR